MWKKIARDVLLSCAIFAAAVAASVLMAGVNDDNNPFAVSVFILAVALIARCTAGYAYGIVAAAAGVLCVNFAFTYPFGEFNMSVTGYPLTFSVMLIVSVIISTLTTRIKNQERMQAEAEREKLRANLLRSVSHDLRTPLTSILGASSALLEDRGISPEDGRELLREINKDARWLVRVTENILSVTKFSGGVALKKETEVVEEVLGSAIVKFRRQPDAVPVQVDKPEEILLAPMDATLIEQVLINLFENAVMHGETTTRVDVKIDRAQGRVRFAVRDDGAGIPPNMLAHVFDGSARAASDGHKRGMGIGLSVCQSIVRAHGGDISVGNNKEGGACVRFWLPGEEDDACETV